MTLTRLRRIGLLLFALALGFIAFFQMFERTVGSIPSQYIFLLPVTGLLFVGLWAVLEVFQPYASQVILPCLVVLSSLGITVIARIDMHNAKIGEATNVGATQLIWLDLALVLCAGLAIALKDYRVLRKFSYVSMVVGIVLLLSPMIPHFGREIGGARIWVGVGSHTLQPGEFAKLFLAFFFAAYLFDHRDQLAVAGPKLLGMRMPRLKDLGPIIVVWILSLGVLVMQHDLGTSLMFFAMFVSMLYVATGRKSWIAIGAVFFVAGAVAASVLFAHVGARVDAWLHPFSAEEYNKDFGGSGQLVRGIFGMATGGLLGTGLGQGHPWITPLANSDFIYSSVGEELGLTGLLVVLALYLVIVATGMVVAMKIQDGFGKLLASGLVFTMAFQVFTVVGGITLVIPLTGLTMPYMAAGGSSLIANCILAVLLIVISNAANRPAPEVSTDTFRYEALAVLREHEMEQHSQERTGRHTSSDAESGPAPTPTAEALPVTAGRSQQSRRKEASR
ncbi:FtsW/RodA/SpoVE family cell cycle protein [Bifidobacterium xylocopae]|uniref:Cell division protein FtsW n=1 Tax=Bifidobacterium xylocopae TaxID=2493119 RepID=A0A366KDH1_9BIFI|nr:FtsW/RodA/SpoVE family cell cycle protein [Bifidobacterium xylocopae]RBP99619.1 cell division protein FtsW [Bifidobacterium xylocopae]